MDFWVNPCPGCEEDWASRVATALTAATILAVSLAFAHLEFDHVQLLRPFGFTIKLPLKELFAKKVFVVLELLGPMKTSKNLFSLLEAAAKKTR